jgi:hypothetical protein
VADRDPEDIRRDIDQARDQLAATVDTLAARANPEKIANDVRAAVLKFVRKPAVTATIAGLGVVTLVIVVRRFRR